MIKIGFKNYKSISDDFYTGYKNLADSLLKYNCVEIISEVENLNSADLLIKNLVNVSNDFRNKCRLTMWESNRITRLQMFDCNKHDVLFLPNQFNANLLCSGGVNSKIEIFDPFISDDFINHSFKNNNKLIIGISCSSPSLYRNDINRAIKCFLSAYEFKKDVELWIKCVGITNNYTDDPRIKFINEKMNIQELIDWYVNIDVLLCCSHGEGIGLMNLEAMAVGRPLLTHTFSAMQSYANEYNSFVYDFKLDHTNIHTYTGKWAYIVEDSLIDKMIYIYDNRQSIYDKSKYSVMDVAKYKSSVSVIKLLNLIKKYV